MTNEIIPSKTLKKVPKDFYQQDSVWVAKNLIGKLLVYKSKKGILSGIINETEAYTQDDPACHAYNGKITPRNKVMFKEGGHIYIYFIYGMYHCLNIVTEKKGRGCAVLIRSIIPQEGLDIIKENRGPKVSPHNLANGPGKLMIALGIPKTLNESSLFQVNTPINILETRLKAVNLNETPRIGISEGKDHPWRFFAEEFS